MVRPFAVVQTVGATVATTAGSRIATTDGNTTTLLQNPIQAAGVIALSSPAHPSHLPDMGMPASLLAAAAALRPTSSAWTERPTTPVASATESATTNSRRTI